MGENSEALKSLSLEIYHHLLSQNMNDIAEGIAEKFNLQRKPSVFGNTFIIWWWNSSWDIYCYIFEHNPDIPISKNTLLEWWSIFWEEYCSRPGLGAHGDGFVLKWWSIWWKEYCSRAAGIKNNNNNNNQRSKSESHSSCGSNAETGTLLSEEAQSSSANSP